MIKFFLLTNGLFCLLGISCVWAEDAKTPEAPIVLGPGLTVDTNKREVLMDATICLRNGLLEFISCRTNLQDRQQSFEHESILSSTVTPSLVNAGLLLIGLEPQGFQTDEALGVTPLNKLSRISVGVEFEEEGKRLRRPLCDMLINLEKPDTPVPDLWIFTGSYIHVDEEGKNHYVADIYGHTIGLTSMGAAVIQFGERVAGNHNPQGGRGQDQGMRIKTDMVPKVGTKVRVIFSPYVEKNTPTKEGADK